MSVFRRVSEDAQTTVIRVHQTKLCLCDAMIRTVARYAPWTSMRLLIVFGDAKLVPKPSNDCRSEVRE